MVKKISIFTFLVAIVIAGFVGQKYYTGFVLKNINPEESESYLLLPRNANRDTVLNQLSRLNVVKDIASLEWMMEQKNYRGKNIVPGKYLVLGGASNNEFVNHLRAGNGRLDIHVSFNQVRDLKGLSKQLTKELIITPEEVYSWLTNNDSIRRYGFNKHTIITMFLPNTYFVDLDITVPELMKRMAQEYKKFWNPERTAQAKKINMSQSEVSTLASIVYWETKLEKDMPMVAGVYMNRIRKGWPLQADPTLIFAIGDYSMKRVLDIHKKIDSPYNTYKYKGLPPGPILIPPVRFIDAVLNYKKHDYMFFVAKEDLSGETYFSKTLSQHNIYARRYHRALNNRKIYK